MFPVCLPWIRMDLALRAPLSCASSKSWLGIYTILYGSWGAISLSSRRKPLPCSQVLISGVLTHCRWCSGLCGLCGVCAVLRIAVLDAAFSGHPHRCVNTCDEAHSSLSKHKAVPWRDVYFRKRRKRYMWHVFLRNVKTWKLCPTRKHSWEIAGRALSFQSLCLSTEEMLENCTHHFLLQSNKQIGFSLSPAGKWFCNGRSTLN